MVVGVGHNHPVAVGDGNVVWMLQLSGLVAHRPEFGHKRAVALEYLDAVVLLVADIDEAEAVGADAPRVVELPVAVALAAEGAEELAAGVEYLDAVVVAVRNDELADSVDSDAGQAIEFAFAVAVAAQPEAQLTALVEDLDSMVGGVSHHNRVIQSN